MAESITGTISIGVALSGTGRAKLHPTAVNNLITLSSTETGKAKFHLLLPKSTITLRTPTAVVRKIHVIGGSVVTLAAAATVRAKFHILVPISAGMVESVATYRGEIGETWLFNATTFAASKVVGYFFESMAALGDRVYGANASGIFEITGTTDAGTAIAARIISGRTNNKSPNVKRYSYGYVYGTSAEGLRIRVADDTGRVYNYNTDSALGDVVRSVRFKVGKGLKSHYFQFAIENVGGSDFEIHYVDLLPAVLERWVKK